MIKEVGKEVFGTVNTKKTIVPDWNHYVKEYHTQAREAFLEWRQLGSPRTGEAAEEMRMTRARFKLALRDCRKEEERLREEAQAERLAMKDMKGYWKDIRKISPRSFKV